MWKFFVKYTLIILVNLFAFLSVWHILDEIFNTKGKYTIIFLVLSIASLALISHFFIKKNLQILNNIKSKDGTNKWK
jgi:membrane protease YdiL (CAAX protease family)